MLRRSTNIILLVGFFIIILFSMGYAQQTTKVGVVNAQEVLEKSTEGKRVIAQLEDKNMKNQNLEWLYVWEIEMRNSARPRMFC